MDKQSTIGIVLIGLILAVWLMMQPKPQPVPPVKKDTVVQTIPQNKPVTQPAATGTQETSKTQINADTENNPFASSVEPEKIITVETDLVRMELTSRGGKIRRYFLKDYNTWYDSKNPENAPWYKKWVQLVNTSRGGGDLDLVFVTKNGQLVNTSSIAFTRNETDYHYKVSGQDSITIAYTLPVAEGKSIVKTYTFFGNSYGSIIDIELKGLQDVMGAYRYDLVWKNGLNFVERNSMEEAQTANASVYMAEEQLVVDAAADETEKKELNGNIDWIGTRNKYFGLILSPLNRYSDNSGAYIEGMHTKGAKGDEREYYDIQLKVPLNRTNYQKDSFQMYFGPMDYDILKSYGKNYESMYEFGNFMGMSFITRPISEYFLLPLFKFLHQFIPNYGIVIIIFSLIIKLVLFPLTKQSYKSMNRMKLLQPKIAEIKEQYKNDPQRVQKETMNLYSKYGVNPMGGCLPMVLQMPILFALFTFFKTTLDLRHQPFVLWIDNLSSPDVLFNLPFTVPFLGNEISGLALFLGITMFLQQKMSVSDPAQKAMVYTMPVMMTVLFNSFASGLNLYYAMFNLFSIIQQKLVNNKTTELEPVKNPKKKSGFMQRMMDAAEQKQKEQQQMTTKKKRK
ncbi:MAG: membrane protein insertase YidC [Rhodothermaceae bacterium]